MKKQFAILTGKHKGKTITLTKPMTVIGRDPEADIRVNSTEVSRLHCEIHLRGDSVIIKDLGARNGTFINGEAIFSEFEIQPGDTLHVGAMVFELLGKKKSASGTDSSKRRKAPSGRNAKVASDADVIDWLAEDQPFEDADTTIVSNAEAAKMGTPGNTPLTPRSESIRIEPVAPNSHAAQAAEIIRQHWAKPQ